MPLSGAPDDEDDELDELDSPDEDEDDDEPGSPEDDDDDEAGSPEDDDEPLEPPDDALGTFGSTPGVVSASVSVVHASASEPQTIKPRTLVATTRTVRMKVSVMTGGSDATASP